MNIKKLLKSILITSGMFLGAILLPLLICSHPVIAFALVFVFTCWMIYKTDNQKSTP